MRRRQIVAMIGVAATLASLAAWLIVPGMVYAHCDTLDGPVVAEAKAALEKGDVTPLLKWVKKEDEEALKAAFKQTRAVRGKDSEAKALADTWLFETLVRLHRAGEGEPYTGLKPAGQVDPPVAAADQALARGSVDELAKTIGQAAERGVQERFARLNEAKRHKDESVEAGRQYVEAYVIFVHYVEDLHNKVNRGGTHGHEKEGHGKEGHDH